MTEKRAAIYARVSTEEQVQGTSLETQVEELKHRASLQNWQVYEYIDQGKTGSTDDREALKRLMLDARAKKFEIVAVAKLDRFMRKLKLLLDYIEELNNLGITFISVGEGLDTSTPMGRFSLQIMGVIAEWERERIIERTKAGRIKRYAEGKWAAGQPLYGYHYNAETKKLEMIDKEATVIKRIFQLYVYDRLGTSQVARKLNEESIKPRRKKGKLWYSSGIKDIISHSGYKGQHPLGIEIPAIVEPSVWDMAQHRRKDNRHLHRRNGSPWLLQGMMKCGLCGHTLSCSYAHNKRRTYSCRGRLQLEKTNNDKCELSIIDAEWLEQQIWNKLVDALSNPTSLMHALDDYIGKLKTKKQALEVVIEPIEARLREIKERKERLAEDWVMNAISAPKKEKIQAELEAEEERLSGIKTEVDPMQIEELETTKFWLGLWEDRKQELDLRLNLILEGERDEQSQAKYQAAEVAKVILGVADMEAPDLTELGSPTTKRRLLDYLQVSIRPYDDRVEIKAMVPMNDIEYQPYSSGYRLSHYPRFE